MTKRKNHHRAAKIGTLAAAALLVAVLLVPVAPAGTLTGMSVSAPKMTTGEIEAWSFAFTPGTVIPANGSVRFLLPAGFATNTGAVTHCSISNGGNASIESSDVLSATEVVCNLGPTADVGNQSQVQFALSNVENPRTAQVTGNVTVETRDENATVLDTFDGHPVSIEAHVFSSGPSRSNPDLRINRVGPHTFSFAPFNPWPADGHLIITFPTGYRFNADGDGSTQATFASGGSGTFGEPTVQGQTLIFKRAGGSVLQRGQGVEVQITSIQNPAQEGPTGPFDVATADAAIASMDHGQAPSVRVSGDGTSTPPPEPEPEPEPEPTPTPTPSPSPSPTASPSPTPEDTGSPFDFDDDGDPTNGSRQFDVETGGGAPALGLLGLVAAAAVALGLLAWRGRDA
jgi:hypothetical protein